MTHNTPSAQMPRRRLLVAALLAATTLSACTTIPQSAPFASEPSQAKKVNPINTISEQVWWKSLGDPQLQRLMNQAFNNSPSLAIAEARLNQAQAAVSQYRASNRPQVGLDATAYEAKQSYNYLFPKAYIPQGYTDYGQTTLSFNWELDFWGRNRAAIAAASSNEQAAEADAAQARLVLSTAIATAYVDLDRLYQERDLAERAVGIRSDSARLVQDKLNNGVSNKAQDAQAQAGVFAARADLAALDEQIDLNRHLIAMLTGASPDFANTLERPALSLDTQAFGNVPTQINLDLIGRRPDIIAARWRAEAASAHIKQAHAAFYPNINIAAFAGFQSLGLDKLFSSGSDIGQVGPALSLPLFDGGALKANLKSAESEHALAIASYNQDVLQAMQQVADTLTSQKALQARLDNSEQALAAYEEAYRLSKLRYDGGLSDYTSLLVAEQSLISQRRTVADLKSRAMTLDVALIKSLGGAYNTQNIAQN
ncbi:efflux transporter outer membrane subunit [Asticcacaulis taihuensis]|uniref:Efflux transporter, outer membrane factor (OMF) lipoprotein, NodT family n=1 Tax=Asticcacaulis taihuensis TaxID=260084 RepID=A0A1G4QIP7_9CAUL|nr:efflux transporter outer membrane subunit [Asticcacaulis taihuensis]SCW44301.1 efflux transporter, outer membrane factor (OMF) lipoprotein, NodT family [Asticcacaulis taihuensis]